MEDRRTCASCKHIVWCSCVDGVCFHPSKHGPPEWHELDDPACDHYEYTSTPEGAYL